MNSLRVAVWRVALLGLVVLRLQPCALGFGQKSRSDSVIQARPVPGTFFGLHIHNAGTTTPWPAVKFGAWRLWDASVAWPNLEPQRGEWNFSLLDKYVDLALKNNVEVLLTLGLTPLWASARPNEQSMGDSGMAAEPKNVEYWNKYVSTVASRYKGKIKAYEIWNEPFGKGNRLYFSGTVDKMIELARSAYLAIKRIDSSAIVVSPSLTEAGMLPWFEEYLSKGGAKYADVIGYHFYVNEQPPEAMIPLINNVKKIMAKYGATQLPLWNTEAGWSKAKKTFTSQSEAASYVARTYIVNMVAGVSRVYWYAWDNHTWVGVELTEPDSKTLRPAGKAYDEIRMWLTGTKMMSCGIDSVGTWHCVLQDPKGRMATIVWNPKQLVNLRSKPSSGARTGTRMLGKKEQLPREGVVKADSMPILFQN